MDNKSEIFNEFFEYFKSSGQKAVAVISDKQVVFRIPNSRNINEFGSDHMTISKNATKDMGVPSNNSYSGCNMLNVHMFFQDGHAQLSLPETKNNDISISQYQFIMEILDAYEEAQKCQDKKCNNDIQLFSNKEIIEDVNSMREELKKYVSKQVWTRRENIIGLTHTKEDIKNQMIYNLDIDNIKSKPELIHKLNNSFSKYYNDSFYHDTFLEAFPNYELLVKVLDDSNLINDLDESLFENTSDYNQISGIIINQAYKNKSAELSKIKQDKQLLNEQFEQIEKEEKAEEAFDELYPKKIESIKVRSFHKEQLEDINKCINELNSEIQQNQLIVSPEANNLLQKIQNFFKKIFNKKIIKKAENKIEQNNVEIKKMQENKRNCEKEIAKDERNILSIDMKFREITGLETKLEEYKIQKEKQENKTDYSSKKIDLTSKITELSSKIKEKENELNELLNTNLVIMDNQKQENVDEKEIE